VPALPRFVNNKEVLVQFTQLIGMRLQVAALALGTVLIALLLVTTPKAEAAPTAYCGNVTLGAWGQCTGAARTFNAVYGWGDQAGVCVSAIIGGVRYAGACSGSAGTGAYNPLPGYYYAVPWIENNSGVTNTVHGVAYQP
jgi:hypothetical protein